MRQVPSSACSTAPGRRTVRAVAAGAASLVLLLGAAAPAFADPLADRHAQIARDIEATRSQIHEHTAELAAASAAVEESQRRLDEARATLAGTRAELAEAQRVDAEVAVKLEREQALLRRAERAAADARARVAAQQELIGEAARDAFQKQTGLAGIGVVLGGQNPADMAQRLQWDRTIFDTTQLRLDELVVLEERLVAAEAAQADAEARVADEKRRAAANVGRVAALEADAVAQEAAVADLLVRNEADRAGAQTALEADNAQYDALLAEGAAVQAQIAEQVARQLSQGGSREDIAQLVAMGVVSSDPSTYPLVDSGPQMILSQQGFIRPLLARPGSPFGPRFHPILHYWRQHQGNDWGAACDVPLYAAQSGTVLSARMQGGFGNFVVIDHGVIGGKSVMTGYAHQSQMVVSAGQRVELGQLIGYVGSTGMSTECHLHLEVYENGTPVDPMRYVP